MSLPLFTVEAQLWNLQGAIETPISDNAQLRFTSSLESKSAVTYDGKIYRGRPELAEFDDDGDLVTKAGGPVQLLANDPGLNVTGLQWIVEIISRSNGSAIITPWRIDAPVAGVTIDLADVPPVAASSIVTVVEGPNGDKGDKGDKGDTGSAGPQGPTGPAGVKGDTGATGPQGAQGIKGDTGNQGLKGDSGPAGPQGTGLYRGSVSSQSAMNALTGSVGDYCWRSDLGMFYYLAPSVNTSPFSGLTLPLAASQLSPDVQAKLALAASAVQPSSKTPTIYTDNTSPPVGKISYYNASGGNLTPTFPLLANCNVGDQVTYRRDPADISRNTVVISTTAGDTFYSSGATTATLPLGGEQRVAEVIIVNGTKYWAPAGSLNPVDALDDMFRSVGSAADYGWRGWSHDLVACAANGAIPNAGFAYLTNLLIRKKQVISGLIWGVLPAGSGLTTGQNLVGLFQNGALLSTSADQSTAWQSQGLKDTALGAPQTVDPANGPVYAGLVSNGTTRPAFAQAALAGQLIVLAPAFKRYAYDASHGGLTTSLPATLGTLAAASPLWVAWR